MVSMNENIFDFMFKYNIYIYRPNTSSKYISHTIQYNTSNQIKTLIIRDFSMSVRYIYYTLL